MSPLDLSEYVVRAARDRASWTPHVRFDPSRRHWSHLPSPDGLDLWLLTWLPAQATELHDHGLAAAAIIVLQGRLTELSAAADGATSYATLEPGAVHEVPVGTIHQIVNAGVDPAVSLHAYSPRLTRMTTWRATADGLRAEHTSPVGSTPSGVSA